MYPWMVLVVVMIVLAMLGGGIWWALADYILDRLGSPSSDWRTGPLDGSADQAA